ncbi:MAG: hypothetical protein GQ558_04520 [Thermoplasmata archaeon]|nr:hypothetical protein [Thermoplasmata archaeon]
MALYLLITPNGPNFVQMGPIKHAVLFLSVVGTISFTGAIVDSMAYTTMSLPVFLIACATIGLIVAIVSVRYLRMDLVDGAKVGIVFFFVNLMMWSAIASDLFMDAAWDYPTIIFLVYILLLVVVSFVIVIKRRNRYLRKIIVSTPGHRYHQTTRWTIMNSRGHLMRMSLCLSPSRSP